MFTFEDPSPCPSCQGNNIYLGQKVYKKDVRGEAIDIAIGGMWFCGECGNVLGCKVFQYENDIDSDSV